MDPHISSQDFDSFASGALPREKARAVVSHLLTGCEICQRNAAALWSLDGRAEPIPENAYDRAYDWAVEAVERELLLQQVSLAA
jgi:hypothetical protein